MIVPNRSGWAVRGWSSINLRLVGRLTSSNPASWKT
jgi:hypothetical protein